MSVVHRVKHFFRWHSCRVVSIRIDGSDYAWIACQCQECGDISGLCEPLGRDWAESKMKVITGTTRADIEL